MRARRRKWRPKVVDVRPRINWPVGHIEKQTQHPAENFWLDKSSLCSTYLSASRQIALPLEVKGNPYSKIQRCKKPKEQR